MHKIRIRMTCQYEPEKQKFYFPAIFGRHPQYLELPKGDMTTPTLGFLLRSYTTIIHPEKKLYQRKWGLDEKSTLAP